MTQWWARACRSGFQTGAVLRDTLERWLRDIQIERGYLPVVTPHLGNIELYKTSGHYPYYADSQYTSD